MDGDKRRTWDRSRTSLSLYLSLPFCLVWLDSSLFLSASGRSLAVWLAGQREPCLSCKYLYSLSHLSMLLDPMHGLVNSLLSLYFSSTHSFPPHTHHLFLSSFLSKFLICPILLNPSSSTPSSFLAHPNRRFLSCRTTNPRHVQFILVCTKLEPKQSSNKNKPCPPPPLLCPLTVHPLSRNTFLFVGQPNPLHREMEKRRWRREPWEAVTRWSSLSKLCLTLFRSFIFSSPHGLHDTMIRCLVHTLGLGGCLKAKVTRVRNGIERETGRERGPTAVMRMTAYH